MTDKMQRVFVANGEVQAQQTRAFLEAAGIPTEAHGESLRHTHGLTVSELGAVEIFVDEADVEQARSLLDSAEAGEFRLGEDVEPPDAGRE